MLNRLLSVYRPRFGKTVIYMLQSVEYQPSAYFKWFWRTQDFNKVTYRKNLVLTRPSQMLLLAYYTINVLGIVAGAILLGWGIGLSEPAEVFFGLALLIIAPILAAYLIVVPLMLGKWLIITPYYFIETRKTSKIFQKHTGLVIAVAGSYGKTTMKEMLLHILSQAKKVAATPANKNVAIAHAQFAKNLHGDEEVLIIEYGEGKPGDVAKFARATKPEIGIITGLAPAHQDKYRTLAAAGRDIFSLAQYVKPECLYVNDDTDAVKPFLKPSYKTFNEHQAANWKISSIKMSIHGVEFTIKSDETSIKLKCSLIGRHQVGPLAVAAALAHDLGLGKIQIEKGVASIPAFEHRMQPYMLSGGWIVDDTYNGNIEGMKAGLALLTELPAKRKIYVTPGLVDQGQESKSIHEELGKAIKEADPDKVVLMKNSVTDYIKSGLKGYKGVLEIEDDPLNFYTNLDKFIAAGDLVLMQNDWPDNYN